MGAHHHHDHSNDTSNILTAFFLNLTFTIIELVGGLLTNSMAIIADAIHDMGDTISLGFAWYMQKIARKPRDQTFSYGYKRFSLLSALINSVVLLVGGTLIIIHAIPRILEPEPVHSEGMFFLAILGIVINGWAVLKVRRGKSINEQVVSWHLLEDVFGWVVVLFGSIAMYLWEIYQLDAILAVGVTCFILWNVAKNLIRILKILLQAIPDDTEIDSIRKTLQAIPAIQDIHDVHIWSMDGQFHVMSLHVVTQHQVSHSEGIALKKSIRKALTELKIDHATIEIESQSDVCVFHAC